MIVGELFLAAFLGMLFNRLGARDGDLFNYVREIYGVASELEKWEKTLRMIQAVLNDAEEKQTDGSVKFWLDNLREFAYDVEDILDEFATEALKRKLMAEPDDQASSSKVNNFLPTCIKCSRPSNVKLNISMGSRIKSMTSRLEELYEETKVFGLQGNTGGISTVARAPASRRPPSSSVPTKDVVYGRDEDKANVLKLVQSNDANFRVIPIVGMAGIGKTTLAREIYNHKNDQDFKFDKRARVCVSDVFDVLNVSREILESISPADRDVKTLNEVQVKLKEAVAKEKVLIVLDDVWNEDANLWDDLKAPFLDVATCTTIIVTTRSSNVARIMGRPVEHYNLKPLSGEDCWLLFREHAFQGREIIEDQILEFRNKIVEKCGGLPLAAKTLGGLLRSKREDAWESILNNNTSDFPEQSGIIPALKLSYHYLPSYLKRCFSYCTIFPIDYEFKKEELVLLWMAEGIIQQSRSDMQLEDWGNECFDDLVSRSICQQSNSDSSKFIMHDLVHDLAQLVSGEAICRLEDANKLLSGFEKIYHSSYIRGAYDGKNKFDIFYKVEYLRTFLPLHKSRGFASSYITCMVLHDLLPKLKKLRVLSLQGYLITQLLDSFKDLRFLRYLYLTGSMICSLPEWTSSLFNLQVLILRNCSCLVKLPSKMTNLINLSHFDIRGANLLKEMPLRMKQLKNLQMLSNFIMSKGETMSSLNDLKNLKSFHGELYILGLENLNDSKVTTEAMLCEKNLEALSLEWGSQFDNSRNEVIEGSILDKLQPHKSIRRLKIANYGGAKFPSWIGHRLFSKMQVLTLENCEKCEILPPLGLLGSLEHLTIKGMISLKHIGNEIFGEVCSNSFQSLETLQFENLYEWVSWDLNIPEAFLCLRELSIIGCPKLSDKLPGHLPSLETLVVRNCAELMVSFSNYPMLYELEIDECTGMVCSSSLINSKNIKGMTISNSALHIHGCKGMLYNNSTENSVDILNILYFGKFLSQGFQTVDTLVMTGYSELRKRENYSLVFNVQFQKQVEGLDVITFPEEVSIEENCLCLVSFPKINFLSNNL